jgi:hypothetical protein
MLRVSGSWTGQCIAVGVVLGPIGGYACYRYRRSPFHDRVEEALRQIDPSARVRDNGEVYFSSDPVGGHARGHELLQRLVDTEHEIVIQSTGGSSNQARETDTEGAMRPCTEGRSGLQCGSGCTVSWNPDLPRQTCLEINGTMEAGESPPYISLAHELIHADWFRRGRYTYDDIYRGERATAGGPLQPMRVEHGVVGLEYRRTGSSQSETPATADDITENILRGECGLDRRARYAQPPCN